MNYYYNMKRRKNFYDDQMGGGKKENDNQILPNDTKTNSNSIHNDESSLMISQEIPMKDITISLQNIRTSIRNCLSKPKHGSTPIHIDNENNTSNHSESIINHSYIENPHKSTSLEIDLNKLLDSVQTYSNYPEFKEFAMDLILKSRRKKETISFDPENHLFKKVNLLEEQLKLKNKQVDHLKRMYNKERTKVKELESYRIIMKNAIAIQKTTNHGSHDVEKRGRVDENAPPTSPRYSESYNVYKQISRQNSENSTMDNLRTQVYSSNHIFQQIKCILQNNLSDVKAFQFQDVEYIEPEGIPKLLKLLLDENSATKRNYEQLLSKDSNNIKSVLQSFVFDIVEDLCDKLTKLQLQPNMEEPTGIFSLNDDLKSYLNIIYSHVVRNDLDENVKQNLFSRISSLKEQLTNHQTMAIDSQHNIMIMKNEFHHNLSKSLKNATQKIVDAMFLPTPITDSNDPAIDIPITSENILEFPPIRHISDSYTDVLNQINNFISKLVHNAHVRYNKYIRIVSEESSSLKDQLKKANENISETIAIVSKFTPQSEQWDNTRLFTFLKDNKNKIESLTETNKSLSEQVYDLQNQVENKSNESQSLIAMSNLLSFKFNEYLSGLDETKYDSDVENFLRHVIASFDQLFDKFLQNHGSWSIELTDYLQFECDNFVLNLTKCSKSLSSRLSDLKITLESYELMNESHSTDFVDLSDKLNKANIRVVQLEDELEKIINSRGISELAHDSTTQLSEFCDTLLKCSTDLLAKGQKAIMRKSILPPDTPLEQDTDEDLTSLLEDVDFLEKHIDDEDKRDVGDAKTASGNSEITLKMIDTSARIQRLEEASENLHQLCVELDHYTKLYHDCDYEFNTKLNQHVKSLNFYSLKSDTASLSTVPPTSEHTTSTDTTSDSSNAASSSVKLDLTPLGHVLHM